MCPSKTIHLSPSGLVHPSNTQHPLRLISLAICQSTDQTALSHGEWWEWSCRRSALDPFNAASTSNNSCLWQLCIIHLVESLSLYLLDAPLSLPLLFQLLLSYFFFYYFPPLCLTAVGEDERENQGSVPSDAACFPLTPVVFLRHTSICLQNPDPVNPACHLNWIAFALYWSPLPESLAATWNVGPLPEDTQKCCLPSDNTINFWLAFHVCFKEINSSFLREPEWVYAISIRFI